MKKSFKIVMYSLLLVCMFFIASCQRKIYTITFEENGGTEVSDLQVPVNEIPTMPSNPTKDGHTFRGWYLDENFKYGYSASKVEGNLTLYAKWDVNQYTISFETNSTTMLSNIKVNYGEEITLHEDPEKLGHDFVGWYTDAALETEFDLTTMPAKDIKLYAKWDAYDFNVKFISADEELVDYRQVVEYGKTIEKPTDPTREGFTFSGWTVEGEFYDFSTTLTSEITLTAKWNRNKYTVNFDSNGGSAVETVEYDYYADLSEPIRPTKEGYTFNYWTLDGEKFSFDNAKMPANNLNLVASWLAGDYTVYFANNHVEATGEVANIGTKYDEEITIPANTYSVVGYTFKEWNSKADGTGTKYVADEKVSNLTSEVGGSVTIYAIWTANSYTISFDANSGNGTMASKTMTYDIEAGLPANEFTKKGYTFMGWATSANGTVTIGDEDTVKNLATSGTTTLYAIWQANTYNVSYNSNGASGTMTKQTMTYDSPVAIKTNSFEYEGFTFGGWSLTSDGEKTYESGYVGNLSTDEDVTLYAIWIENNYIVKFNANGGTGTMLEQSFTYTEEKALTANQFAKTGYTFAGWALSSTGGVVHTDSKEVVSLTSEDDKVIELFAVWTSNAYTITFDGNGAENAMEAQTRKYDDNKTLSASTLVKEGYTFSHWLDEENQVVENEYVGNLSTGKNVTLKAVWIEHEYTIKFNANGGTGTMSEQSFTYTEEKALSENKFTREGYTFVGWAKTANGNVINNVVTKLASKVNNNEEVMLYAIWNENNYVVKFNANSGTGTMSEQSFTYTEEKALLENKFTKEGYTFIGWSENQTAVEAEYVDEATISKLSSEVNGEVTLYAVWNINSYQFTIVYGNGQENSVITYKYNEEIASVQDPIKENSEFAGWLTSENEPFVFEGAKMPAKNVTIYAQYNGEIYVNFELGNYEGSDEQESQYRFEDYQGASVSKPLNDPTREGYTFGGWYDDAECTISYVFGVQLQASDTVYAKWTANQYTVAFNANSGNGTMASKTMTYDIEAGLPANEFTKIGYTFMGWATSANGTVTIGDEDTVKNLATSGTTTLYAIWQANIYNVVFDANLGEGLMDKQTLTYDKEEKLSSNEFTKKGYTFIGWSKNETDNQATYTNEASVTNLSTGEEVTLYAIWQANTYTIMFDGNGATRGTMENQTRTYGDNAALAKNTFEKDGYTFAGWSLEINGKVNYTDEKVDNISIKEDVTLYAVWTEHEYVVVFNGNGATSGSMQNEEYKYSETKALLENEFAKTGYTFLGWSTNKDATEATYVDQKEVSMLTSTNNGEVTLYAIWQANTYTIKFDGNGATSGTMENQTRKVDDNGKISTNTFVKTGYTFVGWHGSDEKEYSNEQTGNLTLENGKVITLTAQWNANSYNVIFDSNGGNGTMASQEFVYDDAEGLSINKFTYTGYDFLGWSTNKDATVATYADQEEVSNLTASGNITLYAVWSEITYTIIFNSDGGSGDMANKEVKYFEQISLVNEFTYTGYTFEGWKTSQSGEVVYGFENSVVCGKELPVNNERTITLYAKWTPIDVTVTFYDSDTTTTLSSKDYKYNNTYSVVTNIPDTNKFGHNFIGWFNVSDDTQVTFSGNTTDILTGDLNVYAVWEPIEYTVKFMLDGEVIFSTTKKFGDAYDFASYVSELGNQYQLLNAYGTLIAGAAADTATYLTPLVTLINGAEVTVGDQTFPAGTINSIYAINVNIKSQSETLLAAVNSGNATSISNAIQALYGLVNNVKNDISDKYTLYVSNGNNPAKDGQVFGEWVLGEDIVDMVNGQLVGTGSIYDGTIPVASVGTEVRIVGTWKKVAAIIPTYVQDSKTLSWTAVDTSSISGFSSTDETDKVVYYIYHVTDTSENLLDTTEENSYVLNTDASKTDLPFFAPGTYQIKITAVVTYTDGTTDGTGKTVSISSMDANSTVSAVIALSNIGVSEELASGNYYYKVDTGEDIDTFIFYTDMDYQFAESMSFELVDANGNPLTSSDIVSLNENCISTTSKEGVFYFNAINSQTQVTTMYYARVLPFITSFDLGGNLQQFNSANTGSVTTLFQDKTLNSYQIGVETPTNGHVDLIKYGTDGTTIEHQNGFKFDLTLKTTGGRTIPYTSYSDLIVYEFKDSNGNVVDNSTMGYYDHLTGAWYFNKDLAGNSYTVTISVYKYYVPQALNSVITSKTFEFTLNNMINVYTHDELKAVYADTSLNNGINIHKDIVAELDDNQYYHGSGSTVFTPNYAWDKNEGYPINIHDYTAMRYPTAPNGNVYQRVSATELNENYVINGNLFGIDGSKLPYANIYSIGNLSSVSGYEIANTQLTIFLYAIKGEYYDEWLLHCTSNSTITYNDLSITGNTKNSSLALDGISLMNKNSGGYCGVKTAFGAVCKANNMVIKNTTIAFYVNYNSSMNIDYAYSASNWANTVYGFGAKDVKITNSYLKDSGGAAIHLEDRKSTTGTKTDGSLYIDHTVTVENYVSGEEGYFKAYSMELAVMQLKAGFEQGIYKATEGAYSLITKFKNDVTGAETEKINFILMMPPANGNLNGTSIPTLDGTMENGAIINYNKLTIANSSSATLNSIPGAFQGDYDTVKSAGETVLVGKTNYGDQVYLDGYFVRCQAIPTKGNNIIILGMHYTGA